MQRFFFAEPQSIQGLACEVDEEGNGDRCRVGDGISAQIWLVLAGLECVVATATLTPPQQLVGLPHVSNCSTNGALSSLPSSSPIVPPMEPYSHFRPINVFVLTPKLLNFLNFTFLHQVSSSQNQSPFPTLHPMLPKIKPKQEEHIRRDPLDR